MAKKKKDKDRFDDDDLSEGQMILGALGLALPGDDAPVDPRQAPARPPAQYSEDVPVFSMDIAGNQPSYGVTAAQPQPVARAPAKKLPALPELPKFVKPEDITGIQGFDSAPVEGKGKIKEITWNLKTGDVGNVVAREKRPLSALMKEALNEAQQLRDILKQQKTSIPAPAVQAAPQPQPQPRPQPQPQPQPRPQPQPQPQPRPQSQPQPQPRPQSQPQPQPQPRPQQQPQQLAHPKPAAPEREVISKPVRSAFSDETLVAQRPIEKHSWQEAQAVMQPTAASTFTATSQQSAYQEPVQRSTYQPQPEPVAPQVMEYEEPAEPRTPGKDYTTPGGRKMCGKCGGSNFREDDDKSKPLSFTPPYLFAKKYTCKDCGRLFNPDAGETPPTAATAPPSRPVAATARQVQAPAARPVQTSWEDTSGSRVQVDSIQQAVDNEQNVRPSDFLAQKGWDVQPLPGGGGGVAPASGDAGGRLVCPNCGSTSFNEVQDKTRPISFGFGLPVYAKTHQCKKCGTKVD